MEEIKNIIIEELRKIDDMALLNKPDEEFVIYGPGGILDSLGLVELVVALEERCAVDLSSNKAMSYKNNPFKTAASLEKFIIQCQQS